MSTFQIVLNEAWTDVTSEEMCGYDYWWLIINLYFILIHLFSSLVSSSKMVFYLLVLDILKLFWSCDFR